MVQRAKRPAHGASWRIRWLDEQGKRQSAVFDEYKVAQRELSRRLVELAGDPKRDSEPTARDRLNADG